MSELHNTATNAQQTQADVGLVQKEGALVDRRAVGSFCQTIHECAAKAANATGMTGGVLGLAGYGEHLVADGTWQENSPRNKSFALGQHAAMAQQAEAWAREPGLNVYVSWALHPKGLRNNKRGRAADVLGVFGLGADLDRDKGCKVRIEDLPLPPTLLICSSRDPAENFNLLWLFNRLITVEEARPLARALADVVEDADRATADPTHVWRVPGTLNWPKKSKVARGRPLTPQLVRLDFFGKIL
jgi:hypothetical protein